MHVTPAPTTAVSPVSPAVAATRRWRAGGALVIAASIAIALLTYFLLPDGLGELGRRAVAIGVFAALLWATEALPLFVTSLSVVGLEVLLLASRDGGGGLARTGQLSYVQFFEPFASSTIILFLGGFLLAAAATKHGLDRAIAGRLLRPFMTDSRRLVMAVIFTTGFLSIWISNTAVAAMMLAIMAPVIRSERIPPSLATAVVLAVAFGASVGGISTPVSTPPNAITISQLRTLGVSISFVEWMLMAMPLAAGMLVITGTLLLVILKPPREIELDPIPTSQHISKRAWATAIVLLAAVAAWITGPWHNINDAVVALIAATVLAAFGVLDRRDVKSIDWDILLLMWGGLALGNALHLTGVLEYVGSLPLLQNATGWALALFIIAGGMIFATFMSNTAAANILVPLALAISMGGMHTAAGGMEAMNADAGGDITGVVRLSVLAGLTVSFSVSMPISTPPNALAYATGKVSSRDMIRVGLLVSLIAMCVLMIGYLWVLPLVIRAAG